MADKKRYNYKKILQTAIWLLLASGVVVLLVAAMTKKDADLVSRVNIIITGVQNHYFLDKKEVANILKNVNKKELENSKIGTMDLTAMEKELTKDQWIRKVEMFFDNNKILQVKIDEREPVARIFTTSGNSFYIDTAMTRLSISNKFSARLPVVPRSYLSEGEKTCRYEIKTYKEVASPNNYRDRNNTLQVKRIDHPKITILVLHKYDYL